jgi:4-aminobutyrate aminotransferase-like enzyme
MNAPILTQAEGAWVLTAGGERLLDLVNGYGAVFLGHGDAAVRAAVHRQVDQLWSVGRWPTPPLHDALAAATSLLPAGMRMAGLYSTGMEGMEFALRVASLHTGRRAWPGRRAPGDQMRCRRCPSSGASRPQPSWTGLPTP